MLIIVLHIHEASAYTLSDYTFTNQLDQTSSASTHKTQLGGSFLLLSYKNDVKKDSPKDKLILKSIQSYLIIWKNGKIFPLVCRVSLSFPFQKGHPSLSQAKFDDGLPISIPG